MKSKIIDIVMIPIFFGVVYLISEYLVPEGLSSIQDRLVTREILLGIIFGGVFIYVIVIVIYRKIKRIKSKDFGEEGLDL